MRQAMPDNLFRAARQTGFDLLFPPGCSFCDVDIAEPTDQIQLCGKCRDEFQNSREAVCQRCGAKLPGNLSEDRSSCVNCRKQRLRFSSVIAMSVYQGNIRRAVLRTKFPGSEPLSIALAQLLGKYKCLELTGYCADVIAPIPMHWTRRLRRGTNTAETMAESLSQHLNVPFAPNLLTRKLKTQRQADLPLGRRFDNVRGAFRIGKGYDLNGQRVLILDDILTTGATCSEAARELLAAGASEVAVTAIARAVPQP